MLPSPLGQLLSWLSFMPVQWMFLMASLLSRYQFLFAFWSMKTSCFICLFLVGFCLMLLLCIQAQAIMLLAGNVPPVSPNTTLPASQGQGPIIMPSGGDGFMGNQAHTSQPGSGLPTLISASSNVGSQPGGGPNSIDELMAGKTKGALTSTNQPEPPNVVTSLGSTTPTYIPAGTILCCLRFFKVWDKQ